MKAHIATTKVASMKTENWCGYDIRFIEKDGEWWAILKDICDALDLRTAAVAQRLNPEMMLRLPVEIDVDIPSRYNRHLKDEVASNDVVFSESDMGITHATKTQWMLAVNEIGIYEALFASRRLEARKFRMWSASVMQKLRKHVGLQGYEVMRMTEPEIQEQIDHILDTLFWDEERKCPMQSVTVAGGDVEQVPFEV